VDACAPRGAEPQRLRDVRSRARRRRPAVAQLGSRLLLPGPPYRVVDRRRRAETFARVVARPQRPEPEFRRRVSGDRCSGVTNVPKIIKSGIFIPEIFLSHLIRISYRATAGTPKLSRRLPRRFGCRVARDARGFKYSSADRARTGRRPGSGPSPGALRSPAPSRKRRARTGAPSASI
jgi:hypothetical protein